MSTTLSVQQALIDGALVDAVTVVHERGRLLAVRPRAGDDPPAMPGTLLPGLVNAHLHLELSWAHAQVPGGAGFDAWVQRMFALERPDPGPGMDAALDDLVQFGTAAVCDIANAPGSTERFAAKGIGGVVQRELLGMHGPRLPGLLERAAESPVRRSSPDGRVALVERASPHATYSTPGPLVRATVAAEGLGHPASIHVSEDLAEHTFLADGTGPAAAMLDRMGLDWSWWEPPGMTPVAWLDSLGVLGPQLLLVHGVHLTPDDRALVAQSGSPLCLCPRSNLHIGGRLPDVPALIEAGIPLALGTDSLASSPDLDVLSEVPVLAEAFPDVPIERWLAMATSGGASALNLPWAGALEVGRAPGLLWVDTPEPPAIPHAPRRWLEPPGERP